MVSGEFLLALGCPAGCVSSGWLGGDVFSYKFYSVLRAREFLAVCPSGSFLLRGGVGVIQSGGGYGLGLRDWWVVVPVCE